MTLERQENIMNPKILFSQDPSQFTRDSLPFVADKKMTSSPTRKSENFLNNDTTNAAGGSHVSTDDVIATSTRDTIVVLITLTIIFFTLVATYFLWRKHRNNFINSHSKLEEYRYSRLSQNDVEVDNISFQGDLTHKALLNSVPVSAEEEADDDNTRPATLCLEYDSLITISNDENTGNQRMSASRHNSTTDDNNGTVNLLIDELSDEEIYVHDGNLTFENYLQEN